MDKYIGIPLIFMLGLFRKKKKELQRNPQNIVIVMIAAIGDTILLSAIIKELKLLFPNVAITLVCSKGNIQAAKNLPQVDHMIKFDMANVLGSFFLLRKLPEYDLLFDFGTWAKFNAFISFVIKANFKVGFKRKSMYRHYIYDCITEHIDELHEIENYRNLVRALGHRLLSLDPEFKVSSENSQWLNPKRKYVVFHMFASGSHKMKKEWPKKLWFELAQRLMEEGYTIILTGGKEDKEQAEAFVQLIGGFQCFSLAGKVSLEETAAVIKEVGAIITVNTGVMHLAAVMDAYIVALHGPTSPERWGPVTKKSVILTPNIKCDQLLSLGFEKHQCVLEDGCISTIQVDDVFEAMKKVEIGEHFVKTSSIL
ncbi:glycosyltransferase family 9 protein [Robertmurraya kyonggiensis]|uniref:Glycosyltransferase family 9 protein n=2 Tax=Robertmurraya kyonggiensis TaxID=1037680 RepID=A0A4U1CZV3_9BACI|nr:glycosyltransferase family 9 protein [Robertmurraya kyonggiensis]